MGYLDMIKEGINNIDNGDPVKALVCFTSAAAIGTTDFEYSSAFFLRAVTYKAGGFDKEAIANYKLAADYYEHKGALNELQDSYGIQYIPVKRTGKPSEADLKLDYEGAPSTGTTAQQLKPSTPPPASNYSSSSYSDYSYDEPRNGFVSFLFGLIIGVGIALSAYWVYKMMSDETGGTVQVLVILGGLIAGIIITFLAWRNRKYILFFIMLTLSIPGWYNVAIEILGLQNGMLSAAQKTAAGSSADIISTNAGWTTFVDGGNAAVKNGTSANLTFGKETIQNAETDVMTLTVNLARGTEWRIGEFTLDGSTFIQRFKTANGIKFSVLGDGADGWRVMFPTRETLSDNCYHEAAFSTTNGRVTQVDIPYSKLAQPGWGKRITFKRNNIVSIKIQRHSTENNFSGSSTIKVFDFETY